MPGNFTSWLGQLPSASYVCSSKPSQPPEALSSLVLSVFSFHFPHSYQNVFLKKDLIMLLSSFIYLIYSLLLSVMYQEHVKP